MLWAKKIKTSVGDALLKVYIQQLFRTGVGNEFDFGATFGRLFLAEGHPSNGNKSKSLTS